MLKKTILNKKAVVFGMEARIALVIISIVSLAITYNRLSLSESRKLQNVTTAIFQMHENILEYYTLYDTDLSEISTIYSQAADVQNKFFSNGDIKYDPWGNQWKFKVFTALATDATPVRALGELVEPKCVVIFSAGPDGNHYLEPNYTATTFAECSDNVGLPTISTASSTTDDYFYKFTTMGVEVEVNKDAERRLSEITQALVNYASASKAVRIDYCESLDQSDADADATCDLDASGTYSLVADLENANFYPKSILDVTAAVYSDSRVFDNTVDADMEDLLEMLGLPKSYKQDSIRRKLIYNSNYEGVTAPTFNASVMYKR